MEKQQEILRDEGLLKEIDNIVTCLYSSVTSMMLFVAGLKLVKNVHCKI